MLILKYVKHILELTSNKFKINENTVQISKVYAYNMEETQYLVNKMSKLAYGKQAKTLHFFFL